jgi:hypothetical protein
LLLKSNKLLAGCWQFWKSKVLWQRGNPFLHTYILTCVCVYVCTNIHTHTHTCAYIWTSHVISQYLGKLIGKCYM